MTPPTEPTPTPDAAPPFGPPLPRWQVTSRRYLLQDRWLTVRADTCAVPGGCTLDPFYVIEERDWVHVFALDARGHVPVVRQYRHAAGVDTVELPGGVVDEGETPLEAARRELREETGRDAERWHAAGTLWANPARQTNRVHLFIATGLSPAGALALDEGEQLEVATVPLRTIRAWISDGSWSQSLHVASFFLAIEEARRLGWLEDPAS
jgi:8-oxo-dGTP pyrophosphatase MutT (NUDIX family)